MSDFASILESVERATGEDRARVWRPTAARANARLLDISMSAAPDGKTARDAYAAHATQRAANDEPPPDASALRGAIAAAGRDPDKLRQLRRSAARALHPDRGGDGAALAECNALIDAALRICRRKT